MSAGVAPRGDTRTFTCSAAAIIVGNRLCLPPGKPCRHTLRNWSIKWLERDVDYVRMPGRFEIRLCGIRKIVEKLSQLEL